CSPHLAETRLVVEDVLSARTDAVVVDAHEVVSAMAPAGGDESDDSSADDSDAVSADGARDVVAEDLPSVSDGVALDVAVGEAGDETGDKAGDESGDPADDDADNDLADVPVGTSLDEVGGSGDEPENPADDDSDDDPDNDHDDGPADVAADTSDDVETGVMEIVQPPRPALLIPEDAIGEDGMVQLWTDRHGTDAMFLALIRRQ
ncbi:MAG: hypothetical protein LBK95_07325, partial [Bifidobacteriaceae bacterium]|nr:hypothetical protein [Bifidobacteriaceae bacterium]